MIVKKEIKVLDKKVLKVDSLITFCYMVPTDYGARVEEGRYINGIIASVDDSRFSVITAEKDKVHFTIEQLENPDSVGGNIRKIKVLGIKDNAIG